MVERVRTLTVVEQVQHASSGENWLDVGTLFSSVQPSCQSIILHPTILQDNKLGGGRSSQQCVMIGF